MGTESGACHDGHREGGDHIAFVAHSSHGVWWDRSRPGDAIRVDVRAAGLDLDPGFVQGDVPLPADLCES